MGEGLVDFGRNADDSDRAGTLLGRKAKFLRERRPVGRRVPLDEDQFGFQIVFFALRDETVDEVLRPVRERAAVIVVAGRRYDAKSNTARD